MIALQSMQSLRPWHADEDGRSAKGTPARYRAMIGPVSLEFSHDRFEASHRRAPGADLRRLGAAGAARQQA
jgi:hypothetical protein